MQVVFFWRLEERRCLEVTGALIEVENEQILSKQGCVISYLFTW